MFKKICKAAALTAITVTLLTSCAPASNNVRLANPSPTPEATATKTPDVTIMPIIPTPDPETTTAPEKMVVDSVTLEPDYIKIFDDGVEHVYAYTDAPGDVVSSLNTIFGKEAVYSFTGEDYTCKWNVSEYTWDNFQLNFPGEDKGTNAGYWVVVDNTGDTGVAVKTRSGINIGDSIEYARAAAGQDALFETFDPSVPGDALLLDGQSELNPVRTETTTDGYQYTVDANGTLVSFDDDAARLIISPQYFHADC